MSYEEKYVRALEELAQTPILEGNYCPPFHRVLRRLGFQLPPPHYDHFFRNFILTSIPFGILWGILMWMIAWSTAEVPLDIALTGAVAAGLLFGFLLALYYHVTATRHRLSRWRDL
ncbi:DUF6404 family protein [uncultured Cohaesibacter sp.]|uniref:DUF6404 family protein n=1 Tax=uncultured Cohaesibacter sp. TaxID=1002546 RepID=UPI0029C80529|nr:DUF6404 family protein [uncultured Cohaesibacter sp.]